MSPEKKKYNSKRMAVYAGMIDAMDFHIGRLLSYLKEKELYENTVFIFVSDNGSEPSDPMISSLFDLWMKTNNYNTDYETLGEKGSFSLIGASFASAVASPYAWYKFFAGEGGLRVPMLISGLDSTSSGSVIDAFSWVTDIVPTMLQLANVKAPDGFYQGRSVEPIVGHSLLPLISGSVDRVYGVDEAIGYELGGNAALFKGPYKILKNRGPIGDDAWHLYHLENDPGEANDLKDVEPLVFESLMLDYRQYVEENGVLPVADDYDQRRQVMIYGLKKRLGNGIPITIGLVLLFVLFLGFARYQRRRSLRSRSQS
jgi:arylsulfatase/uncharacterized sulfatase